ARLPCAASIWVDVLLRMYGHTADMSTNNGKYAKMAIQICRYVWSNCVASQVQRYQRGLTASYAGSMLFMYPVSSRSRIPQRTYCSCTPARAFSSISTPRPGVVVTASDPSTNDSAPGLTISSVFHGQWVSHA